MAFSVNSYGYGTVGYLDPQNCYEYDMSELTETVLSYTLRTHGVIVIKNVVGREFCDECCQLNADMMTTLSGQKTHIDRHDMPPQAIPWSFRSYVTNCRWLWKVRCHPAVLRIFQMLLGTDKLIARSDGFRYIPNGAPCCDVRHRDSVEKPHGHQQQVPYMAHLVLAAGSESLLATDTHVPRIVTRYIGQTGRQMQSHRTPVGALVIWRSDVAHSHTLPRCDWQSMYLAAFLSYRSKDTIDKKQIHQRAQAYVTNHPTGTDVCAIVSNGAACNVTYDPDTPLGKMNARKVTPFDFYKDVESPEVDSILMGLAGLAE